MSSSRMKIAHIVSTFPPYKGGMGNSVYYSAREMARLGHTNVVFTPAYDRSLPSHEVLEENLEVVRLPAWVTIGNAGVLPHLLWRVRDFDIVHLHYPFYGGGEVLLFGLLFTKAKFMIHYHMDTFASGLKGVIFKLYAFFFLPVVARLAKVITCASIDYIKQSELKDYYLNHKDKFVQIPFGVDAEYFYPGSKLPNPTILFVGGLDTQHNFKGVEQLLEAFKTIAPDFPSAKLLLVGKGDLEEHYHERSQELRLQDQVEILNAVSDTELAKLFQGAWVTVLPSTSRAEAFGLVLLESLASGTTVIASNLPGVRNVFLNNEHGYLVRPGDIDQLASKLHEVLSDAPQREALSKAGREWIEKEYSWKKFGQRLEAAYCRVLYTPQEKRGPLKAEDDDD